MQYVGGLGGKSADGLVAGESFRRLRRPARNRKSISGWSARAAVSARFRLPPAWVSQYFPTSCRHRRILGFWLRLLRNLKQSIAATVRSALFALAVPTAPTFLAL